MPIPILDRMTARCLSRRVLPHGLTHASEPPPSRIDALLDAAQDIRCFRVSRVDGQPFDAYEPGAHIDVTAPSGITRQYSLCGNPDERGSYLFAVKKKRSRAAARVRCDDVQVGAELSIGAPRNLFRLTDDASEHVLIAAGIGITPLLSMAYALHRRARATGCTTSRAAASMRPSSTNCRPSRSRRT